MRQDDIDPTVLSHAVRIARYLYPRAYLSAASAVLLGPTPDGRLFLTGQRVQRTRIRALEIIQNKAPTRPSVASAVVADSLGEFGVSVSAVRQRFLEAFRLRSEHAASIDAAMREALAARLIEEYGDPKAASDAVWALARENEWYREGEGAERFLLRRPAAVAAQERGGVRSCSSPGTACPSARSPTTASSGAGQRPKTARPCRPSYGRPCPASCRPSSSRCCPRAGSNRS